jgi:hypothetical protein
MAEKPLGIPYGVWILIILLLVGTLLDVVTILLVIRTITIDAALLLLLISHLSITIIAFFIIYGLFIARTWSWLLLIIYTLYDIVISFLLYFKLNTIPPAFKLISGAFIILYLLQPGVQTYFGIENPKKFILD